MRKKKCKHACWVRNPLALLVAIEPYVSIEDEERADIIEIFITNTKQFFRPDGGFANSVWEKYGTTDGCSQAIIARNAVRKLVGLKPLELPNEDSFLETLSLKYSKN